MNVRIDQAQPTLDEIIATLNRSTLPTVFIEGSNDTIVFRGLEAAFSEFGLSVFPMGGREKVLELYARRNELKNLGKFAFIADQDTWVITGIPKAFQSGELIFTSGYSIENDIYVDGNLEALLTKEERESFDAELKTFLKWYALALSRHLEDDTEAIDVSPYRVIDSEEFRTAALALRENEEYPDKVFHQLSTGYQLLTRGKSLFSLIFRQLCKQKRRPKHKAESILELVAAQKNPLILRFHIEVAKVMALTN